VDKGGNLMVARVVVDVVVYDFIFSTID